MKITHIFHQSGNQCDVILPQVFDPRNLVTSVEWKEPPSEEDLRILRDRCYPEVIFPILEKMAREIGWLGHFQRVSEEHVTWVSEAEKLNLNREN